MTADVDLSPDLDPHAGPTHHKSTRLAEWQVAAIEGLRAEYGERDEYPRPPSFSAALRVIVADWLVAHHRDPERLVGDDELLEAAVEAARESGSAASKRAMWRDRVETHLRDLFDAHHPARPADLRGPEGAAASYRREAVAYRDYGPWDDARLRDEMGWLDDRLDDYERAYEARDLVPTDGFDGFRAVEVGAGIQRLRADAGEVVDDLVSRAEGTAWDPDSVVEAVAREWDVPEASVRLVVDEILVPDGTDWRQALRDGEAVEFAEVAVEADRDSVPGEVETPETAASLDDASDGEGGAVAGGDAGAGYVCDCGAVYDTPAGLGGHERHCDGEADDADGGEGEAARTAGGNMAGGEYVCACGAAYDTPAGLGGHERHCDCEADADVAVVEAVRDGDGDDAENGDADGADGETGSGLDAADLAPDVAVETAVDLLRAGGDRDPERAADLRRVTETRNQRRAAVEAARQRLADADDADAGEGEATDADAGDGTPTDGGEGAGDADDDGDTEAVEAATDGGVRRRDRGDGDTPGGGGRR